MKNEKPSRGFLWTYLFLGTEALGDDYELLDPFRDPRTKLKNHAINKVLKMFVHVHDIAHAPEEMWTTFGKVPLKQVVPVPSKDDRGDAPIGGNLPSTTIGLSPDYGIFHLWRIFGYAGDHGNNGTYLGLHAIKLCRPFQNCSKWKLMFRHDTSSLEETLSGDIVHQPSPVTTGLRPILPLFGIKSKTARDNTGRCDGCGAELSEQLGEETFRDIECLGKLRGQLVTTRGSQHPHERLAIGHDGVEALGELAELLLERVVLLAVVADVLAEGSKPFEVPTAVATGEFVAFFCGFDHLVREFHLLVQGNMFHDLTFLQ